MKKFLSNIKKIVNSINKSPVDRDYFINGGCSNLANYLAPLFLENEENIEFGMFIYAEEEWDVEQINKMIDKNNKESLRKKIINEIILIDHIFIVHEGIVYDANGVNEEKEYIQNFLIVNTFYKKLKFSKQDFSEDFLNAVRETHIFGHHSEEDTKKRILKISN